MNQLIANLKYAAWLRSKRNRPLRCHQMFDGKVCRGEMKEGNYLPQGTVAGSEPGEVVTMSFGGVTKMKKCWKCEKCGHSITQGQNNEQ